MRTHIHTGTQEQKKKITVHIKFILERKRKETSCGYLSIKSFEKGNYKPKSNKFNLKRKKKKNKWCLRKLNCGFSFVDFKP